MTLEQLSQYQKLEVEIWEEQKRLAGIRKEFSVISSPALTGMPSGKLRSGNNKIEQYITKIVDLQRSIESKQLMCNHIKRYIADIPDETTQKIFINRFLKGLQWDEIANIVGKNSTSDSVKKRCYRYILKNL